MANLKGSSLDKQIRDANFKLAAFKEKRNGTNSNKTHSDATRVKRDAYLSDFKHYAQEEQLDGKLNEMMDTETMSDFLEQRLESIPSFSAQEDYLRGWSGMIQGLQQSNVSINIDTSYFNELVGAYKEEAVSRGEAIGEPKLVTTSSHPTEVISELHSPLDAIAQLQYETGIRVSEAYNVINDLERYLNDLKLHNIVGKGGQRYQTKIITLELKLMLLKLRENNVRLPVQSTYYRHLQRYDMSSHDIRAFFTKELYESKIESGFTHKEACLFISKEINHFRIQITEYYLAKFA